jgi:hypothetical protein
MRFRTKLIWAAMVVLLLTSVADATTSGVINARAVQVAQYLFGASGTNGQVWTKDSTLLARGKWADAGGGGGGGTPGGSDTEIQFNDAGEFRGSANLTWDGNGLTLTQTTETFTPLLTMSVAGGDPVVMYPYANGGWEMDLTSGMYFAVNNTGKQWSFGGADEFRIEDGNLEVLTGDLEVQAGDFHVNGSLGSANVITVNPADAVNDIATTYADTTASASTSFSSFRTTLTYGVGGAAAVGTGQNFVSAMTVAGSGSASNEYGNHLNFLRADLGTGYTQTTGPTGRFWLGDWGLLGPIGIQPNSLNGLTLFANNYYNGSPADSPSAGMWITTKRGTGPASDALHSAAATYPLDVGLGITGVSNNGSDGVGYTKGIQIGGFGSPWGESASRVGSGIDISEYAVRGLYIHDATSTPTAAIEATAGAIILGDLKTTGAAGSKKVVCVDVSTGRLYASSTGTDCSN